MKTINAVHPQRTRVASRYESWKPSCIHTWMSVFTQYSTIRASAMRTTSVPVNLTAVPTGALSIGLTM
jgi:hypothetical protein